MYKKWFSDYFVIEMVLIGVLCVNFIVSIVSLVINLFNGANIEFSLFNLFGVALALFLIMSIFYVFKLRVKNVLSRKVKPIIKIGGLVPNGKIMKLDGKLYALCAIRKNLYGVIEFYITDFQPDYIVEVKYYRIVKRIYETDPSFFEELVSSKQIEIISKTEENDTVQEQEQEN